VAQTRREPITNELWVQEKQTPRAFTDEN